MSPGPVRFLHWNRNLRALPSVIPATLERSTWQDCVRQLARALVHVHECLSYQVALVIRVVPYHVSAGAIPTIVNTTVEHEVRLFGRTSIEPVHIYKAKVETLLGKPFH